MMFHVLEGFVEQEVNMDNVDAFAKSLGFSSKHHPLFVTLLNRILELPYLRMKADGHTFEVLPFGKEELANMEPYGGMTKFRPPNVECIFQQAHNWVIFIQSAEVRFEGQGWGGWGRT